MLKQNENKQYSKTFFSKIRDFFVSFGNNNTKGLARLRLRHPKDIFESTIESLTHPFFVIDVKNLNVILANNAARRMADIFGEVKCYALLWDNHQKCGTKDHLCPIDTVVQTKKPVNIEQTCHDKQGNTRYAEVNAYPVFDKKGNVAEVIEYWLDVTERVISKKEVENLAKFPSENPNPVIRVRSDGIVLYTNAHGQEILTEWNCTTGEHVPQSWQQYIERIMKSNKSEVLEIDTSDKTYSFTFAPVIPSGYVNIYATDITNSKKAEDDLRRYREHLEELVNERTKELTQANVQLSKEIQNRIQLEQQILNISETEQRRIGQELHDSLGQQLTGISFMVKVLQQKLEKKDIKESRDLTSISKLVREATDQARSLAKGLHPVDLNSGSLVSSLQELALNTEKLFSVKCVFDSNTDFTVANPQTAVHIYRIAQEAITNAIKHGKAKNIKLSLLKSGQKGIMVIENNGREFPEEFTKRGTGMGLQIMDHRVDLIGGELEIRKGLKGGTVLTCSFALNEN